MRTYPIFKVEITDTYLLPENIEIGDQFEAVMTLDNRLVLKEDYDKGVEKDLIVLLPETNCRLIQILE